MGGGVRGHWYDRGIREARHATRQDGVCRKYVRVRGAKYRGYL